MLEYLQPPVVGDMFGTNEQTMAVVPENFGRLVQVVVYKLLSRIGPMRFTTITDAVLLVEPPKLKPAE